MFSFGDSEKDYLMYLTLVRLLPRRNETIYPVGQSSKPALNDHPCLPKIRAFYVSVYMSLGYLIEPYIEEKSNLLEDLRWETSLFLSIGMIGHLAIVLSE